MEILALREFSLVGGTALSLIFGHRKSVDLDFFSVEKFNNEKIIETLKEVFGSASVIRTAPPFGIFCFINNVKVDLVCHPHPLIGPVKTEKGIRMFSTEDMAAMKVWAVLGHDRKKDFWDIAELLHHYTVDDFIHFHTKKYAGQNLLISVPQAMTYFADADEDGDPVSLKNQSWEKVKAFIAKKIREYLS